MATDRHGNSPYAPERYRASRPYAVAFGQRSVAHARHGMAAHTRFVQDELFKRLGKEITRLGKTEGPGPVQSELLNVQLFGRYDAAGAVIHDIARPLLRHWLDGDSGGLHCADPASPAALPACSYLHFGLDAGLKDDAREIEGAFVECTAATLKVELVPAHFGHPLFFRLPTGEQTVGLDIDLSDPSRSLADAVASATADAIATNDARLAQLADIETQLSAQYGRTVKVPYMIEPLAGREALIRSALMVAARAWAHIAMRPDDVREAWQQDAPPALVAQAEDAGARPGTRRTASNSLARMGYRKIRRVGFVEPG